MNTPGTPPSGARPESHFESAQQANDIYDLYGRDSIYSISGSGADDSASASGSGAASGSGFSSGAGSVLGYARGPSQLRYANRERDHRDDENEQEELDEEFHTPLAFDKEIDFSRAPSRGPDFSQPYAAETQYSRRADSTWTDASEYTEPDEAEVGGQGSNYPYGGGIAGAAFPATMSGESTPTATARGSVSRRGSGDGNGVGLTPVALAGPAFANSRTSTPTPSIVRTEPDADDAPPSPMSAIPPRIRTGTPDLASASTVNSSNTLSPTPTSGSPVHPSITRIYTGSRSGSARSDSMRHSPVSGANSNASLVSSQYPGEDTDAYHVRSTYARLDIEGVFGDGWDEGVERTRGGVGSSNTRITMVFPDKDAAMTDSERKFISSLDRYGFVDTPTRSRSEGRLALVPAAPFSKVPALKAKNSGSRSAGSASGGNHTGASMHSPSGPQPPSPTVPGETREVSPSARRKEEDRVAKWLKMMSVAQRDAGRNILSWRWSTTGDGAKHPSRIYKGVPDRWRMAAWWTLAEDRAAKAKSGMPSAATLEADYTARRDGPSESDVQIDLDVPRTISGHALFRTRFGHGQRALFHVLHSFSQACEMCGYCQGMGSIAATLLCYYEPERAYALLVRMHDLYDMHGIFAPGFPGLLETFYVQERMLECLMPDVYESFKSNMISSSAWGAKIYITLFVNVVPFNVQLRLWDAMFLDGFNVMVAAVLSLLWAFRPLLAAPGATFESILSLLSSFYVPEDEDAMLNWIRKLLWAPGTTDRIAEWRAEWRGLVDRGESHDALL